jgi:hypothetical protein
MFSRVNQGIGARRRSVRSFLASRSEPAFPYRLHRSIGLNVRADRWGRDKMPNPAVRSISDLFHSRLVHCRILIDCILSSVGFS